MKNRIPTLDAFINESSGYSAKCINKSLLRVFGVSNEDIEHISEIYDKISKETGDKGSCVLGNGVKINGKIVVSSYAQGSIGLERIQAEIIPYLKSKYPKLDISYEWGNMD